MHRRSTPLILFVAVACALPVAAAPLLRKVMTLVHSDNACKSVGGKVVGHTELMFDEGNGNYSTLTVTQCEFEVKDKPKKTSLVSPSSMPAASVTVFDKIVEVSGMSDELEKAEQITIFAPSDAALAKQTRLVDRLLASPSAARSFVMTHVILGKRGPLLEKSTTSDQEPPRDAVARRFRIKNSRMMLGTAEIVIGNLELPNGVIHVIDEVLPTKPGAVKP